MFAGYLHRQGILVILYINTPSRLSGFTLRKLQPVPVINVTGDGGLQIKRKKVRTGPDPRHPVSGTLFTSGSWESITARI